MNKYPLQNTLGFQLQKAKTVAINCLVWALVLGQVYAQTDSKSLQLVYNNLILEHEGHLKMLKKRALDNYIKTGKYTPEAAQRGWQEINSEKAYLVDTLNNSHLAMLLLKKTDLLYKDSLLTQEDVRFMQDQLKHPQKISFVQEELDSAIVLIKPPSNTNEIMAINLLNYYRFSQPVYSKDYEYMLFTMVNGGKRTSFNYYLYRKERERWVKILGNVLISGVF